MDKIEDDCLRPLNFIEEIIENDLKAGKNCQKVITRFPPEPNGYLHIGHAKSICLNFGLAAKYNGFCNLRFDDTNPSKEEKEFVDSIQKDVRWLGFDFTDRLFYASDYFEKFYDFAVYLIKKGKAYVCDLNSDQIRAFRGTLTEPGQNSPYRDRSVEDNLSLFLKMRDGQCLKGQSVLRAKIDMASSNLNMRDPVIYRIMPKPHHRSGDKWRIYPMYDFAHCISDSLEGITHSICTLEFENHRPLYDWFLEQLDVSCHPQQIEFARLNLTYTVMSKRKLQTLVEKKLVSGWDDPRMPTLAGLRRRGYTPLAISKFCERIGVAKTISTVDISLLEYFVREDLNRIAKRVMVVLSPLKVVITNYPQDQVEELDAVNNPEDESMGSRKILFSRELYIERDDFRENPPKKFFRLYPKGEVRLKHAYYITCEEVIKDDAGNLIQLNCRYDPQSRGGWSDDGRKVKGTLHWVSAKDAIKGEVRLYDHLFKVANPGASKDVDFCEELNPNSLEVLSDCLFESSLNEAKVTDHFQFLRQGYFCLDRVQATKGQLVFNRTVALRDSWAKIENSSKTQK
ncbi:MAG: glutamine--tRNA ligase/YqeY domain fusion protein [Candidatus Omnitrophica bacterium]|nr:glutamine--tRNA ligase/YqeY domain fusion protein [Candidatus Omnitrophota bacterium]